MPAELELIRVLRSIVLDLIGSLKNYNYIALLFLKLELINYSALTLQLRNAIKAEGTSMNGQIML